MLTVLGRSQSENHPRMNTCALRAAKDAFGVLRLRLRLRLRLGDLALQTRVLNA